jgi:hypothetical protein
MKPVEYASIGGFVFPMEDDACAAVRSYLAELESFYSSKSSGSGNHGRHRGANG